MEVSKRNEAERGEGQEGAQKDGPWSGLWKGPIRPASWTWEGPPDVDVGAHLGNLNARLRSLGGEEGLKRFTPPTLSVQTKNKKNVTVKPGGFVGLGCGTGLGVGVTGAAGFGAGFWNSLHFVFGFGMGCILGAGYGYGYGVGFRWDQTHKDRRRSSRRNRSSS